MCHQDRRLTAKIRGRMEDRPVDNADFRSLVFPSEINLSRWNSQMTDVHRGQRQNLSQKFAAHNGNASRTIITALCDLKFDRTWQQHRHKLRAFPDHFERADTFF